MTVVARRFSARPVRTSSETWGALTDLICGVNGEAALEFRKISGIISALIAEEVLQNYPLVMVGVGPRLRVYCLYDEDALSADERNEDPLNWEPTKGDWEVFLPCFSEDIVWVADALKEKTAKFIAYDIEKGIPEQDQPKSDSSRLTIDVEGFKKL